MGISPTGSRTAEARRERLTTTCGGRRWRAHVEGGEGWLQDFQNWHGGVQRSCAGRCYGQLGGERSNAAELDGGAAHHGGLRWQNSPAAIEARARAWMQRQNKEVAAVLVDPFIGWRRG